MSQWFLQEQLKPAQVSKGGYVESAYHQKHLKRKQAMAQRHYRIPNTLEPRSPIPT